MPIHGVEGRQFLHQRIGNVEDVESIGQEVFLRAYRFAPTYRFPEKLSTWLFAIAYRKAMRGLRKQDDAVEDPEADRRASPELGPDESSSRSRVRKMLSDAISELSPSHRAVVDLTYFHELGYREIAVILECPVDTVKTRMFYARKQLADLLKGAGVDSLAA